MIEILHQEFLGKPLRLEASPAGWQQLYWNNQLVSAQDASEVSQCTVDHSFRLSQGDQVIECQLLGDINWQPFTFHYKGLVNGEILINGGRDHKDIEKQQAHTPPKVERKLSVIGLLSLAMKGFKSAKVIKVALASASVAAYSWLFSFQFAIALIACLMVHEYGHIRAMKYFGMKTKGIYLVPFLGGLALSDEKINTRWQDVVISMMGPAFGFFLSLLLLLVYWVTGDVFFAGLSAFNAFLNLFNLLPILPLDGGHVLKSISFSMNSFAGLLLCTLAAAAGVVLSYWLGLTLFGFLLLMGTIEILIEWRGRYHTHLLPLDRYGQMVSAALYLGLVAGLVAILWYFARTGDAMLALPMQILAQ